MDEMQRPDMSAHLVNAIKTAITSFEPKRFYFTEERARRPTIANKTWYSLPTNFQDVTGLTLIDVTTGRRKPLVPKTFNWLESRAVNPSSSGEPNYFCFYQKQIRLYPTPDKEYTMEIVYSKSLGAVVDENTVSAWFTDGEELIRNAAKATVYRHVIQGESAVAQAALCETDATKALLGLIGETNRRRNTGYVEPVEV